MYCIKCGRRLTDTRNLYICPYCGNQSSRNSNPYGAQYSENYRLNYPPQARKARKDSNFLFFLIPAIGAAVIIGLLIYAGIIRIGSPTMAAEADHLKEYEISQMSPDDQNNLPALSSGKTGNETAELIVKESTNHYAPYIRVKKEDKEQYVYEDLKPTNYFPEETETVTVTPEPSPETVVVTPAPEPQPVVVTPAPEPQPVVVTPAPEPQPVVVTPAPSVPAPTAAPEPAPQDQGASGGNLTPGALRYSPEAYTFEPWRSEQVIPSSSCEDISYMDLSVLSDEALRIARNEIYARHGRMFAMADLQQYFNSCSWYLGIVSPADFDANERTYLSSLEKRNIEYIVAVENSRMAQ